jgi:hypothetical protein
VPGSGKANLQCDRCVSLNFSFLFWTNTTEKEMVFCMRSEVEKDPWLTCIEEQDELVREPGHAGDGHLQSEHQQPNEPDKEILSMGN